MNKALNHKPNLATALKAINASGVLLVFSIKEKPRVPSLWNYFYPRSKMRWEWDDGGDNRVVDLWYLREKLFSSGKVAYAKWFERRATFFSKEIFVQLLRVLNPHSNWKLGLSRESQRAMQILEDNSPISTKELRALLGFQGRAFEADFHRALSPLWSRLLIVGCGEVDDGSFPSLAIGATSRIFETEWQSFGKLNLDDSLAKLTQILGETSPFLAYLYRLQKKFRAEEPQISRGQRLKTQSRKAWIAPEDLL